MATLTDKNDEGMNPRGFLHVTLESDAHIPTSKEVRARRAFIVLANIPKFAPDIVTLTEEVRGTFVIEIELVNGVM